MAKKETIINMEQILEELNSSEGLPENLSTEAQLWDEIMKKETYLMPEQLFPLIREIHGKEYPKNTSITPLATEFSVERSDTRQITSIRADITVIVGETDIYHFECEIKNDSTMVLRMFEYDVHIALSYHDSSSNSESSMMLHFPHSAVLYLQDTESTPDELTCAIHFQDGGVYKYKIPTIKVQSYSLEEIQQKHLCVLIPFLPLRFRRHTRLGQKNSRLQKQELTSFYDKIILILENEVADGYLSESNRKAILSLLSKSLIRVFYKNESMLKEVLKLTEPILELEFEKVERLERELAAVMENMHSTIAEKDSTIAELRAELEKLRNK